MLHAGLRQTAIASARIFDEKVPGITPAEENRPSIREPHRKRGYSGIRREPIGEVAIGLQHPQVNASIPVPCGHDSEARPRTSRNVLYSPGSTRVPVGRPARSSQVSCLVILEAELNNSVPFAEAVRLIFPLRAFIDTGSAMACGTPESLGCPHRAPAPRAFHPAAIRDNPCRRHRVHTQRYHWWPTTARACPGRITTKRSTRNSPACLRLPKTEMPARKNLAATDGRLPRSLIQLRDLRGRSSRRQGPETIPKVRQTGFVRPGSRLRRGPFAYCK